MKKTLFFLFTLIFFTVVSSMSNNLLFCKENNIKEQNIKSILNEKNKNVIDNLDTTVNCMASSANKIYIGGKYLYESDNGFSFVKKNVNLSNDEFIINISVSQSGEIYLLTNSNKIYCSNSNGNDFFQLNNFYFENLFFSKYKIMQIKAVEDGLLLLTNNNILFYKNNNENRFTRIYDGVITFDYNQNGLFFITNKAGFNLLNFKNGIFFLINQWDQNQKINYLAVNDGDIYIANGNSIIKSIDNGKSFTTILDFYSQIKIFTVFDNNIYYLNTKGNKNFVKTNNLYNKLINLYDPKYITDDNHFSLTTRDTVTLNWNFISSATFNNHKLNNTNKVVKLNRGSSILNLTLKQFLKPFINSFGGNSITNQVIYNFSVPFYSNKKIVDYIAGKNTNIYRGLFSTKGNTSGKRVVKLTNSVNEFKNSLLLVKLDKNIINFKNSYYVPGEIINNNFFPEKNNRVYLNTIVSNSVFVINSNGIYQLNLNINGKNYVSYLELGKNNWLIKEQCKSYNDLILSLANKLNIHINVNKINGDQKTIIDKLNNLKQQADNIFKIICEKKYPNMSGIYSLSQLPNGYSHLLDSINYGDLRVASKINNYIIYNNFNFSKLNYYLSNYNKILITNKVNYFLSKYNLNRVSASNVNSYGNLLKFNKWVLNLEFFLQNERQNLVQNLVDKVLRGYGDSKQKRELQSIFNLLFLNNGLNIFLKNITWTSNMGNNFKQLIDYNGINDFAQKVLSQYEPAVIKEYHNDLNTAESNLDLHGYNIKTVLNSYQLPQTKKEFSNYKNTNLSFHDWLQIQINNKFHQWQLTVGLSVGLSSFLLTIMVITFIVYYYYQIYSANGMRKKLKPKKIKKFNKMII